MANLGHLTFWQRLDMYVQVTGHTHVAAAWDLARLPLGSDEHRELAGWLAGAVGGFDDGEPLPEAPAYDPHADVLGLTPDVEVAEPLPDALDVDAEMAEEGAAPIAGDAPTMGAEQ